MAGFAKAQQPADTSSINELNSAQTPVSTNQNQPDNKGFLHVDKMPEFRGGFEKFIQYARSYTKNLQGADFQGQVVVSFVVEKDGSLSNIKIKKSLNNAAYSVALDIMNKCPKWKPAMENGRPRASKFFSPYIFWTIIGPHFPVSMKNSMILSLRS